MKVLDPATVNATALVVEKMFGKVVVCEPWFALVDILPIVLLIVAFVAIIMSYIGICILLEKLGLSGEELATIMWLMVAFAIVVVALYAKSIVLGFVGIFNPECRAVYRIVAALT